MQKDKHNIYSKEELLKLIKEGKNAPADMDEFALEALEGLKMLDNHDLLSTLNKDIDKIVLAETKKEKQRKTIYYFSAAASLLLLVGLVFFFKNSDVIQNEKVVASAETKPKEENLQQSLSVPVQAEPQETYEAKEPEQTAKTTSPKREAIVFAENKAQQKPDNNLEQEKSFGTKNEGVATLQNEDRERKEVVAADNNSNMAASGELAKEDFQQANKNVTTEATMQLGIVAADENRAADKSKKITASMSQPSVAANQDQASDTERSPAAPVANAKKAEEKAKSSLSYSNLALKNDVAKNYKEPAFINGDSTFATYVKQNLKISSSINSGIIVVEFLVSKNGTATNIEILKSLNNCDACSKDVIDFIKSIKKWQPAVQNGNAISAPKKISMQYN